MYYVYLIKSNERNEIYIGSTNDLRRRITQHNTGETISTKRYMPWRLIYYEAFLSERDAKERENKLKHHGKGLDELKKRLIHSLNGVGFTIIELLISISIISLLLGISFAGYARLTQRQSLITAGQNLKNILRDAQNRTMSGELDCGAGKCDCSVGGDSGFSGWYVDFTNQKIYAKCGSYQFGDKAFGMVAEIGISPYLTPPASPLIFKNNPPSSSGGGTICVSHSNIASTYYVIRVKETGAISDEGGLVGTCP